MPERRWTDADRELAGDALFGYLYRLGLDPQITRPYAAVEAVLDALTAAGWRPGAGAALDKHLELHAARVRRETAEAIAAAIEASTDSGHYVGWRTLHAAIARGHAATPTEETTDA